MGPGRPRTPIGTHGAVKTRRHRGRVVAETRVRDLDGRLRQVRATGPTAAAARARLMERIRERPALPSAGSLRSTSSFTDLADLWLADLDLRDLAGNTKDNYRTCLRLHVGPAFEHYTLAEVTCSKGSVRRRRVLRRFLRALSSIANCSRNLTDRHAAPPKRIPGTRWDAEALVCSVHSFQREVHPSPRTFDRRRRASSSVLSTAKPVLNGIATSRQKAGRRHLGSAECDPRLQFQRYLTGPLGGEMADWAETVTHQSLDGEPVTVLRSLDGRHALIARGHVSRQAMGSDATAPHVHMWHEGDGELGDVRIHDIRNGQPLFPNLRDEERLRDQVGERERKARDLRHGALLDEARRIAGGRIDRATIQRAKELDREFREVGKAAPANDRAFRALMDDIFDAHRKQAEQRKSEWASNKAAKERLVSQAEWLAGSSDLRSASDGMRKLGDEWKRIGPCEKADNERLWSRFNQARPD